MRTRTYVGLLIAAGVLLRIFDLVSRGAIELDGIEYARAAELYAKGAFSLALKGVRVPLYPMVVGFFHLFIGDVELAGRLASLFFGVLLIPAAYLFARRFFREEEALLVAAAVSLQPYLVRYSGAVLSESLAAFLFGLAVFSFYQGWIEKRTESIGLSGILLTLAYLTRPEYIIYFIPLACLLLFKERRYRDAGLFVACFFIPAFVFLLYLRADTGFWVIDRKMLAWQQAAMPGSSFAHFFGTVSVSGALENVPATLYHFCEAMCLPYLFLAILGFRRVERSYRLLIVMLVAMHILGRSFVPLSTKRYSIEFAPVVMPFVAQGVYVLRGFFSGFRHKSLLIGLSLAAIAALAFFQGIDPGDQRRGLQKKAGLILREEHAEAIAARLPIPSFYAGARWVNLAAVAAKAQQCDKVETSLKAAGVSYVVIDQTIERDSPFIRSCLSGPAPFAEFREKTDYVEVYRLGAAR